MSGITLPAGAVVKDADDVSLTVSWTNPAGNPVTLANGAEETITVPTVTDQRLLVSVLEVVNTSGAKATVDHTTYAATSGTASASSEFSGTLAAWRAVQVAGASYHWQTADGQADPSWWKYVFGEAKTIASYVLECRSGWGPYAWTFEGSNDGSTWDVLDTQSSISWSGDELKPAYTVSTPAAYTQYRLNITDSGGYIDLAKIWMYEAGTTTHEQATTGTYASDADFGVQATDATTVVVRNQSGVEKTAYMNVVT